MSRILARLVLAGSVVLAAPVLCFVLFIVLEPHMRDDLALCVADGVIIPLFMVAWIRVWSSEIVWSPSRIRLTVLSVLWSAGVGLVAATLVALSINYSGKELFAFVGGSTYLIVWIASTALVWGESRVEREVQLSRSAAGEVSCLECGYNMTGLHEARCPECGARYTLDQLFEAARERELQLADK